jgi:site-specific recombinase XerD
VKYQNVLKETVDGESRPVYTSSGDYSSSARPKDHRQPQLLRRTWAKLCRKNGGDLERIMFLLEHSSIQTTERYLGSEQEIEIPVNDNLGLS